MKKFIPWVFVLSITLICVFMPQEAETASREGTYLIKPGDYLWDIAEHYTNGEGWRYEEILVSNPQILNPKKIYVGDTLKMPADWYFVSLADTMALELTQYFVQRYDKGLAHYKRLQYLSAMTPEDSIRLYRLERHPDVPGISDYKAKATRR